MAKTMTAIMAATAVDDELITWDTPVAEVMPQFQLSDAAATGLSTLMPLVMAVSKTRATSLLWSPVGPWSEGRLLPLTPSDSLSWCSWGAPEPFYRPSFHRNPLPR